jgi:predicted PurR-regulated permease PerM
MPILKPVSAPFYARLALVMVGIISVIYIAILGKEILSPLVFSFLFAVVLLPVSRFLERTLRFKRSLASITSVLFFIFIIACVFYLIGSQLSKLLQDWPVFKQQLLNAVNSIQQWVSVTFHINLAKQETYINNAASNAVSTGTEVVGETVESISSLLFFIVLILIYTFFFLLYRKLILKFFITVFHKKDGHIVKDVIENVQFIIRNYIVGLLLEMAIVSTVCCSSFMILGIKYALLLGILTGVLNIIPYIGMFTSLALSTLITFATSAGSGKVWGVVITIVGMHLIDSNVLLPLIVGSKVRINAMITLLGVLIGGMIWGMSGTFLSIPIVAIAKIICDRVESLKPWGLLLGDEKGERVPRNKKSLEARMENSGKFL